MLHRIFKLYYDAYSGLPRKVWYLSLVLLINRSGAMILPFLTVYLVDKLGYEPTQAAWAMFAFGIGGVVGNYVGGKLNDRYGSWHVQWMAIITSGLLFISMAWVKELWALCGMIFLSTAAADCFRPANKAALTYYTPPEQLTRAFGLQRMAVNLGLAFGPTMAAFLLEFAGYEWLFYGDGLTCLFAATAFLLLIPADRTARPLVDKSNEKELVDQPISTPSIPALRSGWMTTFAGSNLLLMLTFFLFIGILPVEMIERGFKELDYSYLLLFNGLLIVVFEMILLQLVKEKISLLRIMQFGASLIILGNLILWLGGMNMSVLYVYIFFATFGEIFYMPFTHTYVAKYAPLDRRGEYMGVMSASYASAFSLVAPFCFQLEAWFGWSTMVMLSCVTGILAWIGLSIMGRREKRAQAELDLA
ncbi:MAG: MFS transporter [Bacteroidota bacterium]